MIIVKKYYNKKGVTPVIGNILLIAITVLLVALLGVFVFNIAKLPSKPSVNVYFGMATGIITITYQPGVWEFVSITAATSNLYLGSFGFSIINSTGGSLVTKYPGINLAVDVFTGNTTYGSVSSVSGGSGHMGYYIISGWGQTAGSWHYYAPYDSSSMITTGTLLGIHISLGSGVPSSILQGYMLIIFGIGPVSISGSAALNA